LFAGGGGGHVQFMRVVEATLVVTTFTPLLCFILCRSLLSGFSLFLIAGGGGGYVQFVRVVDDEATLVVTPAKGDDAHAIQNLKNQKNENENKNANVNAHSAPLGKTSNQKMSAESKSDDADSAASTWPNSNKNSNASVNAHYALLGKSPAGAPNQKTPAESKSDDAAARVEVAAAAAAGAMERVAAATEAEAAARAAGGLAAESAASNSPGAPLEAWRPMMEDVGNGDAWEWCFASKAWAAEWATNRQV